VELQAIAAELDARLNEEVDFAMASPMPPAERAFAGVYAEEAEAGAAEATALGASR
jgi:TPP-dependent pyruvate/acetoin dehydrogenase alpha subunit